jgi:uncharacterized protein YdhG (YjbR/CyaY superfamily)
MQEKAAMATKSSSPQNIDEYVEDFPEAVQEILQKIRLTIKKAVPQAEETISYKMPTFNLKGQYLIYFAAYKKHIGIYPVPAGEAEFNKMIAPYQAGKGTLQFPLDQPIPYKLIGKIAKARAKDVLRKTAEKKKK